jgi:hypothetical protein
MHAMLKSIEADDPHDAPAIAPDIVPAAWADKVLADITSSTNGPVSDPAPAASSAVAGAAPQPIDTTFRAAAVGSIEASRAKPPRRAWVKSTLVAFLFALCSAMAAVAWQHYGAAARQIVADWTPAFALVASQQPQTQTAPAGQADGTAVQAQAADQASAPPAAAAVPPAPAAADTAAASPDSSQMIQSMSRDLAAMGQQIQELKASIADLKAGQQAAARDNTRTSETRPPEARTVEARTPPAIRTPVQAARPKPTAPPPPMRSAAAPVRRPMSAYPAYPSVQAAAAPPYPVAPAAAPSAAAPLPVDPLDEPVVRPPMPLR